MRADLASRGIAKSDFDLLIASTAIEAGATLVTHDRALHDGSIAELRVEDSLA
jgi:predicted nucleic acid-binding protein